MSRGSLHVVVSTAVIAGVLAVFACSSTSKPPISSGLVDGAPPEDVKIGDGFTLGTVSADLCEQYYPDGTIVSLEYRDGDPPPATGGKVLTGNHFLTAAIRYHAERDAAANVPITYSGVIVATTYSFVRLSYGSYGFVGEGGAGEAGIIAGSAVEAMAYAVADNHLVMRLACPTTETRDKLFSVVGKELHIFEEPDLELVYTHER